MTAEPNSGGETQARRRYVDRSVRLWLGLPSSSGLDTPRLPDAAGASVPPHRGVRATGSGRLGLLGPLVLGELPRREPRRSRSRPLAGGTARRAWCAHEPRAVVAGRQAFCGLPDARRRRPLRALDASAGDAPRDRRSPARRGRHDLLRFARPPIRAARAMRRGLSRSPSTLDTIELSSSLETAHDATASYFFPCLPAAAAADTTARMRRRTAARSAVRGRPSPSSSGRSPTTG